MIQRSVGQKIDDFFSGKTGGRLLILLVLPASLAQAQVGEGKAEKMRLMNADNFMGAIEKGQNVRKLRGNVRFRHGKTDVFCDRATQYLRDQRWVLENNVVIDDGETKIQADLVSFFERMKFYQASGNVLVTTDSTQMSAKKMKYFIDEQKTIAELDVRIVNEKDFTVITGAQAIREVENDYVKIMGKPVFVQNDSSGNEKMRITGELMESFEGGERFRVEDSVRIFHGDVRAEAGESEFVASESVMTLLENPKAWQQQNEMVGDTIRLKLENQQIHEVHLLSNAKATLYPDSLAKGQKPSTISGKNIFAHLHNEMLEQVIVDGTAILDYFVYENGEFKGKSHSEGDKITLYFAANNVIGMKSESNPGKAEGNFAPPGSDAQSQDVKPSPKGDGKTPPNSASRGEKK